MRPTTWFGGRIVTGALLALTLAVTATAAGAGPSKLDARARAALAVVRGGLMAPEAVGSGQAINAQGELDVFIRGSVSRARLEALGVTVRTELPGLYTAYVPMDAVDAVAALPDVASIRGSAPAYPNLNNSIPAIGVDLVRGAGPTFPGVNGQGILVCDVDSGVDYDHADFKDAGGLTRLVSLWDQANAAGPAPAGFTGGTEFTQAQLNATANLSADTNGHGSHVLGIIGGDGSQTGGAIPAYTYTGVAPRADLLMVKTTFATTAVIDGVHYALNKGASLGKNTIVNLSLGSQYGPHDGTSDFESAIDGLVGPGRVVVVSAGNDRGSNWHAKLFAAAADSAKMFISGVAATPAAGNPNVAIDGYYPASDNIAVTLRAPNGQLIGPIALGASNAAYPGATFTGVGRVYIENGVFTSANGDKEIYFEISRTSTTNTPNGTWTFLFTPVSAPGGGRVDMWRFYNAVSSTSSTFTLKNTNDNLISEPGNSAEAITVAAWATKANWTDCGGTGRIYATPPTIGAIASFSSPGPTRDNRQKPDITAPGFGVASVRSFDQAGLTCGATTGSSPFMVNDGGNHIINQGTSMAAPHVTGAAALLMQKYGAMTPAQVKSYLYSHAALDGFTGGVWNQDWGRGKLNIGDLVAPGVTVIAPNGGETLTQCTSLDLTWNAADTQTGVTAVDLELSRSGPGGPFETIATGVANTGSYAWTVTGPPTADGYLRVTAYDGNSNSASDLSDAAFSIVDPVITANAGANGSISPAGATSIACGSDLTYTFTPDACHAVEDVLVDGVSVGAPASYTFTNVQGNHTISVSFAPVGYTITATAGSGGTITPSGAVAVACGADQAFLIEPADCYAVADVVVDGVSVGSTLSYEFQDVNQDHTIDVTFAPVTYTITATAGAGGSISPSGATTVACGADVKFTITTDPCYTLVDVLIDGVSTGGSGFQGREDGPTTQDGITFTDVREDHTIEAVFALNTYDINASAGPGGSIAPSGSTTVNCGDDITFTITPDPCYAIQAVVVDGVAVPMPSGTYTFNDVSENHSILATFALVTYTIDAIAQPGGSIDPSGMTAVNCGDDATFTITPSDCYAIADVLVDGASVGPVTTYTFDDVVANHTIDARFSQIVHTIVATAGTGGTITPSGSIPVGCSESATFQIAAAACYTIADVVVDGVSIGAQSTYTFNNVQADHTIEASFTLTTYTIDASAGPGGTITPSGAVTVNCGDDQTFTMTPDAGFAVADIVVDGSPVGAAPSYTFDDVAADHTISVSFVDVQPPSVQGLFPNGGENLIVGSTVTYQWLVTDNLPVATVDLYVSRDFGATYQAEALGVPNTGSLTTTVSPPGTNVDINPVYSAYLRVTASDGTNTVSDESDAAYSIFDLVVETVVTRFDVMPSDQGTTVRWEISRPEMFQSVQLERGDRNEGPWTSIDATRTQQGTMTLAEDHTAQLGRSYWYRLVARTASGSVATFGPVAGAAGQVQSFELSSVAPNPAFGPVRVSFALAKDGPIDLSVLDVQGRVVETLMRGTYSAGRYQASWDRRSSAGTRVPSGLYFVRMSAAGRLFTQRLVVGN
jgi:subtilisin family serine protease